LFKKYNKNKIRALLKMHFPPPKLKTWLRPNSKSAWNFDFIKISMLSTQLTSWLHGMTAYNHAGIALTGIVG